jgi:hypothetical protein
VKAAKTMLYAKSKLAINMRALTLKIYKEDGSRAETVMTMTLHHPTDCQDQTTSPALTMMREQVDDEDQTEVKMAPFATEGAEGITKCPSTWPAHFAAVTTAALNSFLHQQGYASVHLPDRSCPVQHLSISCDLCLPLFQSIIVSPAIVEANPYRFNSIALINIKPVDKRIQEYCITSYLVRCSWRTTSPWR